MRYVVIILLVALSMSVYGQKADTVGLKNAINELNTALLHKDTVALKRMLNDNVTYGHSNGWVETKKEVIEDLYNGKLNYLKIDQGRPSITVEQNFAAVRAIADLEVTMNNSPVQLKLQVLQVWAWKNKRWQLFSRQSVKMN